MENEMKLKVLVVLDCDKDIYCTYSGYDFQIADYAVDAIKTAQMIGGTIQMFDSKVLPNAGLDQAIQLVPTQEFAVAA
jgi:hypothetical protein